ncbi:BTAD domain-containing putative transcriptional regulator [Taklimakanibacter deserti]|uniref:BTAD domain-containing putative transcriptional regulator n=1 Tax=Taklimakanibacter deserti TaxID=2267839 RepID=UPI000E658885
MASLKLGLLGSFEVRDRADLPVVISAKKSRGLLALLAFSPSIPRERLANLLWSDRGDAQARSSLRQALASLRKDLGPVYASCVSIDDERVSLDPAHVETDAAVFQELARLEKAESLRTALSLYRGPLLEDTTIDDPAFEEWITSKRAALHDLAVATFEKLWGMENGSARVRLAKRLVEIEPLKEFSHLALMQSYADTGEDGLALQHYSACQNLLRSELGIAPGRDIEILRQRLLERGQAKPAPGTDMTVAVNSAPVLPDKPSIAVLPFQNLSGDPGQDYFADGVVEEIIVALSRLHWLFVIARNSSFAYRGRSVDVKQIGRELGVRYVLDGSLRKSADKVRITGELIDAATGAHIWADRFEGRLEDIFSLQDQMTASVVGEISPRLVQAEIDRVQRKPTDSLDAYDHFLRGLANLHKWTREGNDAALTHFYRAIELDPNFATAHGLAARTYVARNSSGWMSDHVAEIAEAERLARRAAELGRDDAVALSSAGFALSDLCGNVDDGDAYVERALALNPNLASAWLFSGWVKAAKGEAALALERLAYAKRLSPNDPQDFSRQCAMSFAHFVASNYLEGLACAEASLRFRHPLLYPLVSITICAALAGRNDQARKAMASIRQINPTLRISRISTYQAMRPEDFVRWKEGLRLAGMPE